ncbi:MAG: RNA-binding cell elongation regulator Jag/EloR [Dehalococcoidia bacterium]
MKKFSGKTVDEATEIALKEMDVELEEIDIKVDNPGRSGIMGFGGEPAEISVTLIGAKKNVKSKKKTSVNSKERISKDIKLKDKKSIIKNDEQSSTPEDYGSNEEAEKLSSELLDYFLSSMGVVADTYIREDSNSSKISFEIEGEDSALLIGKRGETLQSIQFLVRMITSRQLGRKSNIHIDIEDYRRRRMRTLRNIARNIAKEVLDTGEERILEPMSPVDRRIIHVTLSKNPKIITESEGKGRDRFVVIRPK